MGEKEQAQQHAQHDGAKCKRGVSGALDADAGGGASEGAWMRRGRWDKPGKPQSRRGAPEVKHFHPSSEGLALVIGAKPACSSPLLPAPRAAAAAANGSHVSHRPGGRLASDPPEPAAILAQNISQKEEGRN